MMLRTHLLVGLATLASSLRLDSLVSRRAAVIAAAGSLSVPWAAHAVDKKGTVRPSHLHLRLLTHALRITRSRVLRFRSCGWCRRTC